MFHATADDAVLDRFELRERLQLLLKGVDVTDLDDLADRGRQARHMIMNAGLPPEVEKQINDAYASMCKDGMCSVAVRSSATAEDLPNASFAGQQASFRECLLSTQLYLCGSYSSSSLFCLRFLFIFYLP